MVIRSNLLSVVTVIMLLMVLMKEKVEFLPKMTGEIANSVVDPSSMMAKYDPRHAKFFYPKPGVQEKKANGSW